MLCSGLFFREILTNMHPEASDNGQRGLKEQIWDLELFILKERKYRGQMDVFQMFRELLCREGGRHLCLSRHQHWIHKIHRFFFFFFWLGQGFRSHLPQGVQIIFPLFASFKQLVMTIWNTVLRRIPRFSLNSLSAENTVSGSDVYCRRWGPLPLRYHVFHVTEAVCTFAPWVFGRLQSYCKRYTSPYMRQLVYKQ